MTTNLLGLEQLESWLWDSANILRGSIDSSDFKNYIFGLLFLKRASDVFEEEIENKMKEEGLAREEAIDEVFFKVPEEARWQHLITFTENIGVELDKGFAAIERENKSLEGVMTATKFGDKERLSDAVLQRLLKHFNRHSLKNSKLESSDLLGDAYEYLIKMFADDAGKKGGEFYTPRGVVQLIVQLIQPKPGHLVYDPTCGSGGMLIEAARYVAEQDGGKVGKNINVSLFGQERNLSTWAIGKLNMLLHNYMDADLRKGDTLVNPRHRGEDNTLKVFDRVIANPPFSMKAWWTPAETNIEEKMDKNGKVKKINPNYKKEVSDKFGRLRFGIPPRGYADMAFLQHMIAVLKDDGIAGVVLPHGTLFRGGAEGQIRKGILEADLVEGIIGLPSSLFYNTGIPASIWIINKKKSSGMKGRIFMIDANMDYKEGKNQNELEARHVEKIVSAYQEAVHVPKYMRVVDIEEIQENDFNLNISRYIDNSEPEPEVDIKHVLQTIEEIKIREIEIDRKLTVFLNELGM